MRLNLYPRFEVIGLSYLLSLDISFGVWFFAFLAYVHTGVERLFGWSIGPSQPYSMPASASVAHLAQGAMFFLVFSILWAARQHIGDVLRKAFKRDPTIDDSGEMLSYRTAVLGFIFGSIFAVWWLAQTGLQFGIALFYFLLCLATFIGFGAHCLPSRPRLRCVASGPAGIYGHGARADHARSERADGARHELPLDSRFAHLRHGLSGDRPQDRRGYAFGDPAAVLGDRRDHSGHADFRGVGGYHVGV